MSFTLLPAPTFVADATTQVQRAKHRIYLTSTVLSDDTATHELLEAIREAARRGVDVLITGDMYTYTEIGGLFKLRPLVGRQFRSLSKLKDDFEDAGAKFIWLGQSTSTWLNGRTHSKWIIVDNVVYSFGGTNMYAYGITESVDYMFKTTNAALADVLAAEHRRIIMAVKKGHAYRSHLFEDHENLILIDGGFVGDSLIYRRAVELAREAEHILYVSQYCPTGKLGRALKGKFTTLYFNRWDQADSLNAPFIRISSKLSGNHTAYTRDKYLHAKYMVFTMPDETKVALSGSHNFANGGVWLGTREIALETRDPHVIQQLEEFTKKYVA